MNTVRWSQTPRPSDPAPRPLSKPSRDLGRDGAPIIAFKRPGSNPPEAKKETSMQINPLSSRAAKAS